MRQFSFYIQQEKDLIFCLHTFQQQCPDSYASILVSIFTTWAESAAIKRMTAAIHETMPGAKIIGATTTSCIINGSLQPQDTVLTFNVFETSSVHTYCYNCLTTSSSEAGQNFIAQSRTLESLTAIELLSNFKTLNIKPFLEYLSCLNPEIAIFGGGADAQDNEGPTYVFTESSILDHGIAAVCFCGPELHVHISSNFGWKPLGRIMHITAMDGDCIIRTLDHQSAISVYEKYLNITKGKSFHKDTMEFPIFIERNGHYLARLPITHREDGSLNLGADCRPGEPVQLAYGDPNEMIRDALKSQQDMSDFGPEGIFIFSCFVHHVFLQNDVRLELEPYKDIAPSCGFYTYGELSHFQDTTEIQNMLLLTVGLREGKNHHQPEAPHSPADTSLNDTMFLVQRLVRFLEATTTELEEANRQLADMARMDRLTKLYNRGEIETILKNEFASLQHHPLPAAVIMIDLDDFKSVNDKYGHSMGDEVLQGVANILISNIRHGDSAGRWGGEEFVILLPGANVISGAQIAERIRQRIACLHMLPDRRTITASFGVAQFHLNETYDEFYQRLDKALYLVKQNGKNQVQIAEWGS